MFSFSPNEPFLKDNLTFFCAFEISMPNAGFQHNSNTYSMTGELFGSTSFSISLCITCKIYKQFLEQDPEPKFLLLYAI